MFCLVFLYHRSFRVPDIPGVLDLPATTAMTAMTAIPAIPITMVEASDNFRVSIHDGYTKDKRWARTKELLQRNNELQDNAARLPSSEKQGLLFYDDAEKGQRLCIPDANGLLQVVFQKALDKAGHGTYARTHQRITQNLYIRQLPTMLKAYLRHCPACQINSTKRHNPFGVMQAITTPPTPFHTVAIDFVLALPKSTEGYNNITIINKRIELIPGQATYRAEDWADRLLRHLNVAD